MKKNAWMSKKVIINQIEIEWMNELRYLLHHIRKWNGCYSEIWKALPQLTVTSQCILGDENFDIIFIAHLNILLEEKKVSHTFSSHHVFFFCSGATFRTMPMYAHQMLNISNMMCLFKDKKNIQLLLLPAPFFSSLHTKGRPVTEMSVFSFQSHFVFIRFSVSFYLNSIRLDVMLPFILCVCRALITFYAYSWFSCLTAVRLCAMFFNGFSRLDAVFPFTPKRDLVWDK